MDMDSTEEERHDKLKKEEQERAKKVAAGIAAGESVNTSVENLGIKYAKPNEYTGNRHLYDSPRAKINAKKDIFSKGKPVRDPYSKEELLLKKRDAKAKYGKNWDKHLAEADHIDTLENVHGRHKNDAWTTNEDIKEAANSKENLKVVSREQNNAKRGRTNEKFYGDEKYLKDKEIKLSKKSKKIAIQDGKDAEREVDWKLTKAKVENVTTEFHRAGTNAAYSAAGLTGAMSAITNITAIIKGEKSPQEALKDLVTDTAKSAGVAYGVGGGLTVVAHTLSVSSSPFIKSLAQSNVPGQIVSAVMATGSTLLKYAKGEIDTKECIQELGATGVSMSVTGYSMAVGQTLIPIPFVGAAVGAMVGAALCGGFWNDLNKAMNGAKLAREEYERVRKTSEEAISQMTREREAFETATKKLFADRAKAVNEGFDEICAASKNNDFDKLVNGLNRIANAFGKDIGIHNMQEFDEMMLDSSVDFEL